MGEVDRITVRVTPYPDAVIDFLTVGEGTNQRLPRVSRRTLKEAATADSRIAKALSCFNHPSSRRTQN